MNKLLKKLLIDNRGKIALKRTPEEKVKGLIKKLHPVNTNKGLIRVGPNGDGGYLVPNDLEGIKACFSPGVDIVSQFELECLNRGMDIYLADKSVDKPNLDISEDRYHFIKKFVGCTNNQDFITMDAWVNSANLKPTDELLLQMDIEEGEYNCLINISDELMSRFRIIVIEFHRFQDLWIPDFFNKVETVIDKLLQTHTCVHIHPNNCDPVYSEYGTDIVPVAEFTFLRNDRISFKSYANQFPHPLDFDNTTHKPVVLPESWYRKK